MTISSKQQFENYVRTNIKREGVEDLLAWLESETDFYTSPASTRYHGSYEGGLLDHSLNVYEQLLIELDVNIGQGWEEIYSPESVAIVALFHDLCKIGRYIVKEKWRKDDKNQWESYTAYAYDDTKLEMGHGPQSNYYLQQFIKLEDIEAQAIFWHMGAYDISPYATLNALSKSWQENPLAFLLSRADMAATYIIENENFPKIEFVSEESEYAEDTEYFDEDTDVAESDVEDVDTTMVESVIAPKMMYFIHEETNELIKSPKGTDVTDLVNDQNVTEIDRATFNKLTKEQEAEQEQQAIKEQQEEVKPKIRVPRRGVPKPKKVEEDVEELSEESAETTEESEDSLTVLDNTEEEEVVPAGTRYFVRIEDGYPMIIEDEDPVDPEELELYDEVTEEDYQIALEDWENANESEYDEEENAQKVEQDEVEETTGEAVTYWIDLDEETYFKLEPYSQLPEGEVEQVSEKEYLDVVCPKLDEDLYYFIPDTEEFGVIKKGKRLPEDYDEETWEEITKQAYNDLKAVQKEKEEKAKKKATPKKPAPKKEQATEDTEEAPKVVAKARPGSRKRPAPTRRPK